MKIILGTQEQIKLIAINLRKEGKTYSYISKTIKVSTTTVWNWFQNYKKKGVDGLKYKKRGVKIGTNRKLTNDQLMTLEEKITYKTPVDFGIMFFLWSRQAIQNLIFKLWSIDMPLRTITDYMKRLGFTPQKPVKRAYKQCPKAIKKWLEEDYPKISKRAKSKKAEIHWLDETRINSNSNYLRGFSPKGKTPVIRMKAKYMKLNIISSITNRGKMRFLVSKENINTDKFVEFTESLCSEVDRKIFLILDNLPSHHSKYFNSWIANNSKKIEVFYLPSYSPELNPDERLNRDLKTHFHSGPISRNEEEFMNKLTLSLTEIQESLNRVKFYFKSHFVRYAG